MKRLLRILTVALMAAMAVTNSFAKVVGDKFSLKDDDGNKYYFEVLTYYL